MNFTPLPHIALFISPSLSFLCFSNKPTTKILLYTFYGRFFFLPFLHFLFLNRFWGETFCVLLHFLIALPWNPRTFIIMPMMLMVTSVMGLRAVGVALLVLLTRLRVMLPLSADESHAPNPIITNHCGNYLSVPSLSGLALDKWCFFLCFISLVWSCALALSLLSSVSLLPLARSIVAIKCITGSSAIFNLIIPLQQFRFSSLPSWRFFSGFLLKCVIRMVSWGVWSPC